MTGKEKIEEQLAASQPVHTEGSIRVPSGKIRAAKKAECTVLLIPEQKIVRNSLGQREAVTVTLHLMEFTTRNLIIEIKLYSTKNQSLRRRQTSKELETEDLW